MFKIQLIKPNLYFQIDWLFIVMPMYLGLKEMDNAVLMMKIYQKMMKKENYMKKEKNNWLKTDIMK